MSIRIQVHNLGKRFRHRGTRSPGSWRNLFKFGAPRSDSFWALHNVTFTVKAGETLGVIGENGAGKSTLLTLLSGISDPTAGRVSVTGRIGALLELGGGFVDELTGRENAFLAGVSAGLTRGEVRARLAAIVDFAGIGEFLDDPVRTYSTGMRMRLAFAVAVHTDPEVLLVDEFLSVGDLAFQAKCRSRIAELKAQGCAIVVVSHGLGDVRETCDRVLWLREGECVAVDTPTVVTELYEKEMHQRTLQLTPDPASREENEEAVPRRVGSKEMEITGVAIRPSSTFRSGAPFVAEIAYRGAPAHRSPIFVVTISRPDGTVCLDTNTQAARVPTGGLAEHGILRFSIPRLELARGNYFLDVGVFEPKWRYAYDHHWHLYPFTVDGAGAHRGILAPPCRWEATGPVNCQVAPPEHPISHERAPL